MDNVLSLSPHMKARVDAEEAAMGTMSEDELALRFVHRFGGEYRSVPGWGWMRSEVTRWTRDTKLRHFDDARSICRDFAQDRPPTETKRLASAKTVAAVIQLARADQRIVMLSTDFDTDPMALNTPAGIVDLRNGSVRPHARDPVTKQTAVAPMFDARPTTWMRFLDDVFDADYDVIGFVHRLLGYALTGMITEQVIAFFHGDGANGKSTLLDVVIGALGDYAIKIPSSLLMAQRGDRHPTDIAQLCGVRLAVANEVSEGEHWDESRVKELTGDMKLSARFMRQDFFQFDATHKFLIAANHRPQVRTMDHAMRRRLLLVPFNRRFDGDTRDPDMLHKLKAESGEILAWMIEGAVEWHTSGLQVPERIRAASNEYADTMDSLGLWLAECCQRTGDALDCERSSLLYHSYSDWKRGRGESPVSQTRWGEQMRSRGFDSYRNNGIWYRGLELLLAERQRIEAAAERHAAS